jgi:hypothetical protein
LNREVNSLPVLCQHKRKKIVIMSVVLDYKSVDQFVETQKSLGNDVRWEGWDLVFFRKSKNDSGWSKRDGAYRNGNWGFPNRIAVGADGKWRVPNRNVRTA